MTLPETNFADVRRWYNPRYGQPVDIAEQLGLAARRVWSTTVAIVGLSLVFVVIHIAATFISGRAAQLLDAATRVH